MVSRPGAMAGCLVLAAALLFTALPGPAAASSSRDHPIAGVISLLEKLEIESKQEGETEAATYQKFTYWCKKSQRKLKRAIRKETKVLAALDDKIGGLATEAEQMDVEIGDLDKQLEELNNQAQRAVQMRKEEHTLYEEDIKNLDGSIEATDEALVAMKDEGASALIQLSSHHHLRRGPSPEELMKMDPGKNNPFKPKAKKFSSHEGGVIETFKSLEDGWNVEKLSDEEKETNAINAYKLAKLARDNAIKAATAAKQEKESLRAETGSEKAQAESDRSETAKMMEGDTATMENTKKDCATKAGEYDERVKIRNNELEALAMAQKILSKVTGVRNPDDPKKEKSLMESIERVQEDTAKYAQATSFLQILDPKTKAVNLLKQTALSLKSKSLQKFAEQLGSYKGPFDKIKQMIQKMVFRLMSEQKDEDDHKNWCDLETEKNTDIKDDKAAKVTILTKKVEEMDSSIKLLVKQIMENDKKVESITEYMKEETSIRTESHDEIVATIKDAVDSQAALSNALAVLKAFYKKSGMIPKEPWEFLQTASHRDVELPDAPSTWDSSYTGVADPKNGAEGVLTILDETMQKFSKMEADAKVQDETDQKNYDQDMAAQKVQLEETNMDTQMKTTKKESIQEKMEGVATALKHTNSALDSVETYLKDLEPACGTGDTSYEDRKKARQEEIEALKKAEVTLEDAFKSK